MRLSVTVGFYVVDGLSVDLLLRLLSVLWSLCPVCNVAELAEMVHDDRSMVCIEKLVFMCR